LIKKGLFNKARKYIEEDKIPLPSGWKIKTSSPNKKMYFEPETNGKGFRLVMDNETGTSDKTIFVGPGGIETDQDPRTGVQSQDKFNVITKGKTTKGKKIVPIVQKNLVKLLSSEDPEEFIDWAIKHETDFLVWKEWNEEKLNEWNKENEEWINTKLDKNKLDKYSDLKKKTLKVN